MLEEQIPWRNQALEACIWDAASFAWLYVNTSQHPQAALLFHGLVPFASMYVVESYNCLTKLEANLQSILLSEYAIFLKDSRHRAKLLDDPLRSIGDVTGELIQIAEQQREYFLAPHKGILGPIKRWIQPDMGLSTYNGHIFSTTHSTTFGFGLESISNMTIFNETAFNFGFAFGSYTKSILDFFNFELPTLAPPTELSDTIMMRDIKYEALYKRGTFGFNLIEFSAGLALLLSTLNYVQYILRALLPNRGHTYFRLKFIAAFHANLNIKAIQDGLVAASSLNSQAKSLFRDALGNKDSRWLRKQRNLRNLLVHYLCKPTLSSDLPHDATRVEAIQYFGRKSYDEMDSLLDRNIALLSEILETGFKLEGDPFWYGSVSN